MRIQVKPHDIKIPEDDPFQFDKLDRKEPVEILARLIGSLEGPCVLTIDAAWGNGKSTFLRILGQYLRNQGFPVAEFNAWENDYSRHPFAAISTELTDSIGNHANESTTQNLDDTIERAKEVLKHVAPAGFRTLLAALPTVGPNLADAIDKITESYANNRISAYKEAKEAVYEFKEALRKMAHSVPGSRNKRSLILMIDELDRCRPSYAVELLEAAKHLFSVEGIIFVLAVNRRELAHSIQAMYGPSFNADGYLGRFFDVDFRLPESDRSNLFAAAVNAVGIQSYQQRTTDRQASGYLSDIILLLNTFLGSSSVGLRTSLQAIHHLGLVYAALTDNQPMLLITSTVALVLRTIDRDLYYQFIAGNASDLDVVDSVYNKLDLRLTEQNEGACSLFEAWIIIAQKERDRSNASITRDAVSSNLLLRHQSLIRGLDRNKQKSWTREETAHSEQFK